MGDIPLVAVRMGERRTLRELLGRAVASEIESARDRLGIAGHADTEIERL